MKIVHQLVGFCCMLMAPLTVILLLWQAYDKVSTANYKISLATNAAAKALEKSIATNTLLQWVIIILIFIPIAIGLFIFGKYATQGEYLKLPHHSGEI